MSMMTLEVEVGRGLVELTGSNCKYWQGCGLPDYEGPISGLPTEVIKTLLDLGAIKNIHLKQESPQCIILLLCEKFRANQGQH